MRPKRRNGARLSCPDYGEFFYRVRAFERRFILGGQLTQRADKSLQTCRGNMGATDKSFEEYQLYAKSTRPQIFSAAFKNASPSRSISSSRSKAGCDFSVVDSLFCLQQRMFNDEDREEHAAKQASCALRVSDESFTDGSTPQHASSNDVARSHPAEGELQYPPLDGYESYESWASGADELCTSHESSTFRAKADMEDDLSRAYSVSQMVTGVSGVEEGDRFGGNDATEWDG